jgi:hypothetical protein
MVHIIPLPVNIMSEKRKENDKTATKRSKVVWLNDNARFSSLSKYDTFCERDSHAGQTGINIRNKA